MSNATIARSNAAAAPAIEFYLIKADNGNILGRLWVPLGMKAGIKRQHVKMISETVYASGTVYIFATKRSYLVDLLARFPHQSGNRIAASHKMLSETSRVERPMHRAPRQESSPTTTAVTFPDPWTLPLPAANNIVPLSPAPASLPTYQLCLPPARDTRMEEIAMQFLPAPETLSDVVKAVFSTPPASMKKVDIISALHTHGITRHEGKALVRCKLGTLVTLLESLQ